MISDPVHISLDSEHAAVLANVARQTGKSYQQLVADAIDLAFDPQSPLSRKQLPSAERQENLSALLERSSQLPVLHPQDGLSGRDHDQILYGD